MRPAINFTGQTQTLTYLPGKRDTGAPNLAVDNLSRDFLDDLVNSGQAMASRRDPSVMIQKGKRITDASNMVAPKKRSLRGTNPTDIMRGTSDSSRRPKTRAIPRYRPGKSKRVNRS